METRNEVVNFSIAKVTTEQFAVIEKSFDEKQTIHLSTDLRYAIDRSQRIVMVYTLFKFEQKNTPFLLVEVSCQFLIASESWKSFIKDKVTTEIPKGFMIHLGMITVGTARGVLHTKTEGSKFNDFVLPTIDVMKLVTKDAVFTEASP